MYKDQSRILFIVAIFFHIYCPKYIADNTLSLGQKKVAIAQINLEEEKKILSTADKDASLDNIYFKEIYKFFNIIGKTVVAITY